MAKAEKIVVELSARDRRLIQKLIDAVDASKVSDDVTFEVETRRGIRGTVKRLTEPGGVEESFASRLSRLSIEAHEQQIRNQRASDGEGDWQLQNEEKVEMMTEKVIYPLTIGLWYELNKYTGYHDIPHAGRYETYLDRRDLGRAGNRFFIGGRND